LIGKETILTSPACSQLNFTREKIVPVGGRSFPMMVATDTSGLGMSGEKKMFLTWSESATSGPMIFVKKTKNDKASEMIKN